MPRLSRDRMEELSLPCAKITQEDRDLCPGLHFCYDYDYLLIDDSDPEYLNCTCYDE